jgi:hypothetical protein
MGRFDLLTQLDENQPPEQKPAIAPVASVKTPSPAPPVEKPIVKEAQDKKVKSASLQTRKRAKLSLAPALPDSEMVEKYTTHVEPSLVKKVQIEAIEQGINDYDVVRIALKEYFEKNQ